jgi:hypothetical protein
MEQIAGRRLERSSACILLRCALRFALAFTVSRDEIIPDIEARIYEHHDEVDTVEYDYDIHAIEELVDDSRQISCK